ncbi:hypothetical protein AKA01nite_07850 [Alkalibacterium kapii]|uniref:Uncharacterized protein n=1 Tax=Alkalibacterium kapii TaxID=426704 RepID=A0A511AUY7_9LACT|nr:hypothetical protein AKA01nite_07850 [Alkalibacterium kapii]
MFLMIPSQAEALRLAHEMLYGSLHILNIQPNNLFSVKNTLFRQKSLSQALDKQIPLKPVLMNFAPHPIIQLLYLCIQA